MLLRKPLPVWINVSLFAGTVAMIPLASQLRRQPVDTPRTMSEFSERLSRCVPPLHVVPQLPAEPESSMWICTRPRSREQLWVLACDPKRVEAGQWQGIVFCERMNPSWVLEFQDEFIRNHWGRYGTRIGPFVIFGDPDLLQRIREAILDYKS